MDIEKLKKMNMLTKDLQKGFALSSDEAFKQAEQIYHEGASSESVVSEKLSVESDFVSDARVSLLLEMQEKRFAKEVSSLRSSISSLSDELVGLRKELLRLSQSQSAPPVVPVEGGVEAKPVVKVEEKADHPRQGKYKSEDVAIEKMFYFGNK